MSLNRAKLIRKNLSRQKIRSILLIASIAVAFFLYAGLASFEHAFNGGETSSERLIVASKTGNTQQLPFSHINRLNQLSDIATVTYMTRIRTTYRDPNTFVGVNAVEPESYAAFFQDEYDFGPDGLDRLKRQRNSILVGRSLVQQHGCVLANGFRCKASLTGSTPVQPTWISKSSASLKASRHPQIPVL